MADPTETSVLSHPVPFGKYYLLERIATGGMAEVFKAKAFGIEGFERLIAVKRILPTIAENAEFTRMFVDEAKLAGQLQHANIAQIFDLGRVEESYYIALEYVAGRDLRSVWDRLRQRGQRLPTALACYIMARVLEGLEYAHNKTDTSGQPLHIVHRDVSPQNMLLSFDGDVKLIDFGVAKAASSTTETRVGILKGKLSYMSPEQVRGLAVDRRSDTFSCGTVLYELVTGERLFVGESDFETLERIRKVEVAPPSLYNPDIPRELEDIILHALQKNPNHRYESAAEMQSALMRFLLNGGAVPTARDLRELMQSLFAREIAEERARHEYYQTLTLDTVAESAPPALSWDDAESETQVFQRADEVPRATGSAPAVFWGRGGRKGSGSQPAAEQPATQAGLGATLQLSVIKDAEPTLLAAHAVHDDEDDALDAALAAVSPPPPEPSAPQARPAPRTPPATPPARASTTTAAPAVASRGSGVGVALVVVAVLLLGAVIALFARSTPRTGEVALFIEPAVDARVLVDGAQRYSGPLPTVLRELPAGAASVRIEAAGFEPLTQVVTVSAGEVEELRAALIAEALPPVPITSTPAGARVLLDGAPSGTTPTVLTGLRPGARHTLQLVAEGQEPLTHEFVAEAGMQPLTLALAPQQARVALAISTEPTGARLQATDSSGAVLGAGVAPMRLEGLAPGSTVALVATMEGHTEARSSVTLTADAEQSATIALAAVAAAPEPAPVAAAAEQPSAAERPAAAAAATPSRTEERPARTERAAPEPEPEAQPAPAATGPGRLNVASRPAGRLIIDGADTGLWTPVRGYELAPGRYRIELVNEELGMRQRYVVQIRAGQDETVRNVVE
jgi:serine/threonine protein kinase